MPLDLRLISVVGVSMTRQHLTFVVRASNLGAVGYHGVGGWVSWIYKVVGDSNASAGPRAVHSAARAAWQRLLTRSLCGSVTCFWAVSPSIYCGLAIPISLS
jgi:hypothetical protein